MKKTLSRTQISLPSTAFCAKVVTGKNGLFEILILGMTLLLMPYILQAQVKIGDNLTNVNANSILELESTTKALLLPRLNQTQIDAMQNVPAGMLVYNSTTNVLNVRTSTGWTTLALAANAASATNPWSTSASTIYTNSSKVGVGTSNPVSQLSNTDTDIVGSDGVGGNTRGLAWGSLQPGYVGQIYNGGPGANSNGLVVKVNSTAATALDVSQGPQSGNAAPLLTVKSSGQVGIGTNQPFSQLANNSGNTSGSDGFGGNGGSLSWSASQQGYVGQIYNGGPGANSNGLVVKVNSTTATAFDVSRGPQNGAATPLLTVKSGGQVGIGVSNPFAQLTNNSGNPTDFQGVGGNSNDSFSWASSGAMPSYVAQINNSGAGTSRNGMLVKVHSTDATAFAVYQDNLSLLTVKADQKVGINKASPTGTLDVNGNIVANRFDIGVQYLYEDESLGADYISYNALGCPTGTKMIGGGGGHRDSNEAGRDIEVAYSGPDPDDLNRWKVIVENNGLSSRMIRRYVICAKVQ